MDQNRLREIPSRILDAVGQYVQGKEEQIRLLVVALLAGGHVLVEGPPGTGKTLMARCFAQAMGGQFKRVQLTPDLLPSDATGFNLYRPDGSSEFIPGPLFANIVLADELNRTTARTQSAFLEAMAERQVTIDGTTHALPRPFMVVASQAPHDGEGTFRLPPVQVDRFLFRLWSGNLEREIEARVLESADLLEEPRVEAVTSPEAILQLRNLMKGVHVSDLVLNYILDLTDRLRGDRDIVQGPSIRAGLALYRGCRAQAFLEGRDYAIPDDVRTLASAVFEHRIVLSAESELDEVQPETLIQRVLEAVPVPKESVNL